MCRVLTKEHFIPQKSLYFVDMRKVITSFQMLSATLCFKRVIGPGGRSNPIFSRPGRSQGLLYKHLCNSFINWFSHPLLKALVKISLRRRHALMVGDGAFSHKMDYVFKEILNLEGHPNRIAGSKVTAIWLNWWILPIGGASSGRICAEPAKQAFFF